MGLYLATVKSFLPKTGSEAQWNAAFYRLEDYFRALRLVNKVQQSQIILGLLESAAARHALDTAGDPTALAMEEACAAMDHWFEGIFGPREQLSVVGLISLLAVDAPEKWPLAFPTGEIPVELRRDLLESDVRAGPNLQVSSMTPRPIDVGSLLDPSPLSDTLNRAGRGVAILAVVILAAVSIFVFLIKG